MSSVGFTANIKEQRVAFSCAVANGLEVAVVGIANRSHRVGYALHVRRTPVSALLTSDTSVLYRDKTPVVLPGVSSAVHGMTFFEPPGIGTNVHLILLHAPM